MRRNLSMVLILTMLITIIPGNFIVLADGSVNTQVTLFRETSGGSSAYVESQLYPNTNMGAEFRIKNDGSGNAFVRPIAALYFNEKLQKVETKDYNIQSGEEVLYKPVFFIPTDNCLFRSIQTGNPLGSGQAFRSHPATCGRHRGRGYDTKFSIA